MRWDGSGSDRKAPAPSRDRPATGAAAIAPAITDADLVLGKLDPHNFAGGAIKLIGDGGRTGDHRDIGRPLALETMPGRLRHLRGGRREHGERRPGSRGRKRQGHLRLHDDRLRRRCAAACRPAVRKARASTGAWCRRAPASGRRSASSRRRSAMKPVRIPARRGCRSSTRRGQCKSLTSSDQRPKGFVRRRPAPAIVEITAFMRYAGQGWEIPGALARPALRQGRRRRAVRTLFEDTLRALLRPGHRWSRRARDRDRQLVGEGERRAPRVKRHRSSHRRAPQPVNRTRAVFDPATEAMQPDAIVERDTLWPGDRIVGRRSSSSGRRRPSSPPAFDARDPERRRHPARPQREGHERASSEIRMQVMWNRLISVVEEQAMTLAAHGLLAPSVREAGDLSAGVFDPHGQMLAQAVTGTPGHVNTMAEAVGHFIDDDPAGRHVRGRHLRHQRPLEGHRPSARHHHGLAVVPRRRAGRLFRLHGACRRCRWPRLRRGRQVRSTRKAFRFRS